MRGGNRGNAGGNRGGGNRNSNFGQQQQEEQQRRREQAQTIPDIQTSTVTQRTPPQRATNTQTRGQGGQGRGQTQSGARTLPNGRVRTQSGREFGKQQSTIAKGVGAQQKARAGEKGPKRAATAQNAQENNPRARLPNFDDIDEENERNRRRFVDYDEWYATYDPISNPLKSRLKRSKLRKKKGSGLVDELSLNTGNSVLESYRKLGRNLTK